MSCVLRASGENFDVDAFLATCELEPIAVFRKGEPRFPSRRSEGPCFLRSGLNFDVSEADFSELGRQVDEALAFVRDHSTFISSLRAFDGVDSVTLDFGVIHPPGWWRRDNPFDCELLLACGKLGISLNLSVYLQDDPVQSEPIFDEQDSNLTMQADSDNAISYYNRARKNISSNEKVSAIDDLKKAIEIDPNNIDYFILMDWLLMMQTADWNVIISNWDKCIDSNPENDIVYLERGGAYFHKGDIASAVADLKCAADLGNEKGRILYEKYKDNINK